MSNFNLPKQVSNLRCQHGEENGDEKIFYLDFTQGSEAPQCMHCEQNGNCIKIFDFQKLLDEYLKNKQAERQDPAQINQFNESLKICKESIFRVMEYQKQQIKKLFDDVQRVLEATFIKLANSSEDPVISILKKYENKEFSKSKLIDFQKEITYFFLKKNSKPGWEINTSKQNSLQKMNLALKTVDYLEMAFQYRAFRPPVIPSDGDPVELLKKVSQTLNLPLAHSMIDFLLSNKINIHHLPRPGVETYLMLLRQIPNQFRIPDGLSQWQKRKLQTHLGWNIMCFFHFVDLLLAHELNKVNLADSKAKCEDYVAKCAESKEAQETFLLWIRLTSLFDHLVRGGSNAAFILNKLRIPLSHQRFSQIKLKDVSLASACFSGTKLNGSVFDSVEISRCDFSGSDLRLARWTNIRCEELGLIYTHGKALFAALSLDETLIVAGGFDNKIRCYDAKNYNQINVLAGHKEQVSACAFSPDGQYLATASYDKSVIIWDIRDYSQYQSLQGHEGPVTSLSYQSSGNRLVSGSSDKTARIWNSIEGKQLGVLEGHTGTVSTVAFTQDGSLVATGSIDKQVIIWDAKTMNQLNSFTDHNSWVTSVAISPNGNWLASGSFDNEIRVRNLKNLAQNPITMSGHTKQVTSISFSPNSNVLLSSSGDCTIRAWNVVDGTAIKAYSAHQDVVESVYFHPQGRLFLSGGKDNVVRIWDAKYITLQDSDVSLPQPGKQVIPIDTETKNSPKTFGKRKYATAAAISPNEENLALGRLDGKVLIMKQAIQAYFYKGKLHKSAVIALEFSPDGQKLFSAGKDQQIQVLEIKSLSTQVSFSLNISGPLSFIQSSVNGSQISFSSNQEFGVWKTEDRSARKVAGEHSHRLLTMLASTNKAVVLQSKKIIVYDIASKKAELSQDLKDDASFACSSASGKEVFMTTVKNELLAWDLGNKSLKSLFKASQKITSLSISPDNALAALGYQSQTVQIFNLKDFKPLIVLQDINSSLQIVGFSKCSKLVYTRTDSLIKIWDAIKGNELKSIPMPTSQTNLITFSPDQSLAAISQNKTIKIFDPQTGAISATLRGHKKLISYVAFSSDSKYLLSSGFDKTISFWKIGQSEKLHELDNWLIDYKDIQISQSAKIKLITPDDKQEFKNLIQNVQGSSIEKFHTLFKGGSLHYMALKGNYLIPRQADAFSNNYLLAKEALLYSTQIQSSLNQNVASVLKLQGSYHFSNQNNRLST